MRHFGSFLLFAAVFLSTVQNEVEAQDTFGGFAGVNFSDIDVDNLSPETLESRTGFMVGGWVGKRLGGILTLRLEGYWTQKGADVVGGAAPTTLKINYIEVPLILRVEIPLIVIKPAIYAGPAIAFKTSCSVANQTLVVGCDDPGTNFMVKSTDLSGIIGAGIGLGPIVLDVQYDVSFSDITDDPDQEVKNKTWTIRAAFGI
jgi:hypothetical protein